MTNTPIFSLTADGQPFDTARVLRIEVTDAAGFESDQLTITLDDTPPHIARPREGAQYQLALGYREWGAPIYVGTYVFEEIERSGYTRTMTLLAKAADHAKTLKQPKTRVWEATTFGAVIKTIAADHGLKPVVADAVANLTIEYAAQTDESDQNFMTRMARKLGVVVAPKDGHLIATDRHSGKTASGKDLPPFYVTRDQMIADNAYTVRIKPRARHSVIIAKWHDTAAGRTNTVKFQTGGKGPSMTIRRLFQTEPEAYAAARAKARDLQAGEGEMSVTIIGTPHPRAETPITMQTGTPDLDGKWIASTVTHEWDFSTGGATTTIEAEFGMDEKGGE